MSAVGAVYDRTFFVESTKTRGHRPRLQFGNCNFSKSSPTLNCTPYVIGRQTVSRILYTREGAAIIHLGLQSPEGSSSLPGNYGGPPPAPQAAPCFPIWPCSVWGLPSRPVTGPLVRSYRTLSPLPFVKTAVCFLLHFPSLTSPRVTRHTALWSSDFPRMKFTRDHPSACQP